MLRFDEPLTWDTVPELADRIEQYVRAYDWVTFAELENKIDGLRGDLLLSIDPPNVVLWAGMSEAFIDALEILRRDRRVFPWPTVYLTYLIDGGLLKLPIAKRPPTGGKRYAKERWLPVCLRVHETQ